MQSSLDEFQGLLKELDALDEVHKQYLQKLETVKEYQRKCIQGIAHQKYRMQSVMKSVKTFVKNGSEEDKQKYQKLEKDLIKWKVRVGEINEHLPKQSGRYLRVILGNVNVSLLNKEDCYAYKDDYEKFKLIVTAIAFFVSFLNLFVVDYRFADMAFMFLLVWYYCTLTIRESILRVNGSKIKGWWRTHHFLSTVASGVLLTWPDGASYQDFRKQFYVFNNYIALVQFLQFWYQQGCLYRLKALGERHNMDITIEGFHSWMWRGLSFLLPFLYIGYFFQLYNAYTLYEMSKMSYCTEWQVPVVSALFFIIFLGNTITTSLVIPQKLKEKLVLKYRFSRFAKLAKKNGQPLNDVDKKD